MLIKCPECGSQISDKALSCPQCGMPFAKNQKKNKMKLPNGFGQISKINGRLRNPYRVMVTVGKNEFGKPICKLLRPVAYFPSYNEAYKALVEYNKNPYDLNDDITVKELYEKWFEHYRKTIKESSERTIKSAWSYCSEIYDLRAKEIRARHIKACMDSAKTPNISARIKSIMNLMFDYALEYELVDKNPARTFNVSENIRAEQEAKKKDHVAFTDEEISILWKNINLWDVKLVLIQTYTGLRPQELCKIESDKIDLEENIILILIKMRK